MALCPECKTLSPYRLLARPVHQPREEDGIDPLMYLLKPTFSSLRISAETCQLCQLFLRDVELNYVVEDIESAQRSGIPTPVQVAANSAAGHIDTGSNSMINVARLSTLWVVCGDFPTRDDETDGSSRPGLLLAANEEDPAAISGDISGRLLPDDPASPSSINTAKMWLETCLASHEYCRAVAGEEESSTILPTRVIDVGLLDGSQDPRLVVPGIRRGRYSALSHCWGKLHVITTTRATFAAHMQKLPLVRLPRTFQDAVWVTRHLGLQYLWIDSLCIVQDNMDDWRREASRMAGVYTNATVTIAATAARDSSVGLFPPRKQHNEQQVQLEYECKEKRGRGKNLGNGTIIISHNFNAYDANEQDNIDGAPLNQRAWVLQERLLSRRTLHFAAHQMFWECNRLFASADGTLHDPNPEQRLKQSFPVLGPPGPVENATAFNISMIKGWCRVLEEYTRRVISKDTDRLPAIFGLATSVLRRQLQRNIDSIIQKEYLAGLWRHCLHIGLLWQAKYGGLGRPSAYRAPSWSWASLEGPIQYDTWLWSGESPERFFDVLEFKKEVDKEWLRMLPQEQWRLMTREERDQQKKNQAPTELPLRDTLHVSSILKTAIYDPDIKFDMGAAANDSEDMVCGTLKCKETGIQLGWCALDEARNQRKQELYCFLISRSKPLDAVRQNRNLTGTENILVLADKHSEATNQFIRIGTGQIDRELDWFGVDLGRDRVQQRSKSDQSKQRRRIKIF